MNFKKLFPLYSEFHRLNYTNQGIKYHVFVLRKLKDFILMGGKTYWQPVKSCKVGMPRRLFIGKNSNVIRDNNFLQCSGGVYIGNYVEFATRVSLLSSNHDLYDQRISHRRPIVIGNYCWLGMNTTILAGVELGPRTVVANGAVVTKSFPEGKCVLAGVPARLIKKLDDEKIVYWKGAYEYYGYIDAKRFEENPSYIIRKYLDPNFFKVEKGKIVLKPDYLE